MTADGQLLIGAAASPYIRAATLTAGANINITNGAGSITIESTASGGLTWEEKTDAAVNAAVNYGYIANRAGGVTFTLPATAAVGDTIAIVYKDGLWVLAQNAGQTVHMSSSSTTAGVGGSLTAAEVGCCIELVCITADTTFRVRSSMCNITVV